MTRQRLMKLFFATPVLLGATAAEAHQGGHDAVTGLADAGVHIAGSPFHLAMIVGAIAVGAVGAVVAYRFRKSRVTRS